MDEPFSTHQHDERILSVGYSPSGDQLALGGEDGWVTIYRRTTFKVIQRLQLKGAVRAVAYSRDDKYLAAGGDDKKVTVIRKSDFEIVRQISFHSSVRGICFAADHKHLAVGCYAKEVHIYFTSNFTMLTVKKQEAVVQALSYSPDGKFLLVGLDNNTIAILDATNYEIANARQTNVGYDVGSISYSLTGKYIAVGTQNQTTIYEADNLMICEAGDPKSKKVYDRLGYNHTAFHRDGTLTITYDKTIHHFHTSNWNDDIREPMYYKSTTGGIGDSSKLPPDRLGYQVYAEGISTVASSVEIPSESFCVGLIAPWGAGKTFLWRLIKNCLINAAATRANEIKKEDESTKLPVSRLEHTAVLALAAWCWVARMLVRIFCRIFCLNCRRDDKDEKVLNSSLKEEEKVATTMILIFPIGIVVWITCFFFVIMFHVILFILKVAPEVLFVPFKAICYYFRDRCGPPLERVKTLWKDLSEVKDAKTDPVIPEYFFFCWQDGKKTINSNQETEECQNQEAANLLPRTQNVEGENRNQESDNLSSQTQRADVESQIKKTEKMSTTLKWSRVRNVLTGGGKDIYSSRDFEHISFCGQIQIIFLSYFQKLFKACLAALSCMNFIFPKNYEIEKGITKYIFVEFNAWVYSGTDLLWAKLIEMLWVSVENTCGSFSVRWHRASISLSNENKDDDIETKSNKRKAAIIIYVMKIVIPFVFGSVVTYFLLFVNPNDGWKEEDGKKTYDYLQILLSSLSFSPTLYFIVSFAANVLPELLECRGGKILNQVRSFEKFDRQGFSQQTGFMGEVETEVKYLFDFLRTTYATDDKIKRRHPIRLAVFVDDLDRCPKNIIMQVLEAVILLLVDAPITCYLAIDTRRVVTSIEDHFGERFINAGLDGYQYLEKIIQLPFCMPNLDQVSKENFLTKALEGDMLDPLKLYQRLKHLYNKNIPEIKEVFIKPQEDLRNTKEAKEELIKCLERMIEKDIFLDENKLLHTPQEALNQIREPSLLKSSPENRRIQDEFSHWISIGIENILVKWRNGSSLNKGIRDPKPEPKSSLVPITKTSTSRISGSIDSVDKATAPIPSRPLNQISYDTLFTPLATSEELGWFHHYAKYFVGKPRKMNRIINSYMVGRIISNLKRQQTDNSLPFNKKLLKVIILLEQWPYQMAWILLIAEIFQHEKDLQEEAAKLAKEDYADIAEKDKIAINETIKSLIKDLKLDENLSSTQNLSLFKIYTHIVQVLVHSSGDSANQLQRDGDAQVFKKILLDGEGEDNLKMSDIFRPEQDDTDSLRQYAFNLQRHTIEKVAMDLESCVVKVDETNRLSYKKKSDVFITKP